MAITLTGFAQALIMNISAIAAMNDPQLKLTPTGFLKMLIANNATTQISNIDSLRSGMDKSIKLRYLQRGLESDVTDQDNCDTNLGAAWKETEITHPLYSKIGIFISDDDFRKYQDEAVQTLSTGNPSATMMRGLYEVLLSKLIGLIGKIDDNLVAAQASKWGGNAAYATVPGTNPTTSQNITLGTTATLDGGIVKLQEDALINEINDKLLICGNGLVTRYDIYNRAKSGIDNGGFGKLLMEAYYDPRTISKWGKDFFGAFAKGAVGFVDYQRYVGAFAGEKGGSIFFTLPVPVEIDGQLSSLNFDCQLKYNDCPTLGSPRGWHLIVSKSYGLFNLPNDCFAETDVLNGVNGSFLYKAVAG